MAWIQCHRKKKCLSFGSVCWSAFGFVRLKERKRSFWEKKIHCAQRLFKAFTTRYSLSYKNSLVVNSTRPQIRVVAYMTFVHYALWLFRIAITRSRRQVIQARYDVHVVICQPEHRKHPSSLSSLSSFLNAISKCEHLCVNHGL